MAEEKFTEKASDGRRVLTGTGFVALAIAAAVARSASNLWDARNEPPPPPPAPSISQSPAYKQGMAQLHQSGERIVEVEQMAAKLLPAAGKTLGTIEEAVTLLRRARAADLEPAALQETIQVVARCRDMLRKIEATLKILDGQPLFAGPAARKQQILARVEELDLILAEWP